MRAANKLFEQFSEPAAVRSLCSRTIIDCAQVGIPVKRSWALPIARSLRIRLSAGNGFRPARALRVMKALIVPSKLLDR